MAWTAILDPVFAPLLKLGVLWTIIVLSLLLSVLITVIYKYMTDQERMKHLKEEVKRLQKEMKTAKDTPGRMMEIQKKMMAHNKELMLHSLKPTLITFLPLIFIFGWLQGNLSWEPIQPGQEFLVEVIGREAVEVELLSTEGLEMLDETKKQLELKVIDGLISDSTRYVSQWKLKGKEGDYTLQFRTPSGTFTKNVIVTNERKYETTLEKIRGVPEIISVESKHNKIIALNLFGWKLGWLGSYILFSLLFSILARKLMRVH